MARPSRAEVLAGLTVHQLRTVARAAGVPAPRRLRKDELFEALRRTRRVKTEELARLAAEAGAAGPAQKAEHQVVLDMLLRATAAGQYDARDRARVKHYVLEIGLSWQEVRYLERLLPVRLAPASTAGTTEEGERQDVKAQASQAKASQAKASQAQANHAQDGVRLQHLGGEGMHVVIAVSGFMSADLEADKVWAPLVEAAPGARRFVLRWPAERLTALGLSLVEGPLQAGGMQVLRRLLPAGVGGALAGAGAPMLVVGVAASVGERWRRSSQHADAAGHTLGELLAARTPGPLPVTLVGFSLGGRVVFRALERLAQRGEAGIVENAFVLGGAFTAGTRQWRRARRVVAGRLVNAYSRRDRVLSLAYRALDWEQDAAGLQPAPDATVENVDLTRLAGGHLGYWRRFRDLLAHLQIDDTPSVQEEPVPPAERDVG